jgi:hypothetical protein
MQKLHRLCQLQVLSLLKHLLCRSCRSVHLTVRAMYFLAGGCMQTVPVLSSLAVDWLRFVIRIHNLKLENLGLYYTNKYVPDSAYTL